MSPPARALLALAAAALLHAAHAAPQQVRDAQCTLIMHGTENGRMVVLPLVYVAAGTQNARVDIKNPCATSSNSDGINGEQVYACDDVAPQVTLPDLPQYTPAYVFRQGDYNNNIASVQVTFWCLT